MTEKKRAKVAFISFLIIFPATLVLAVIMRLETERLLKTGIETTGIVTHTYISKTTTSPYTIRFSFIKGDTLIDGIMSLGHEEKELYFNAVVGNTYKVRYFADKPLKKARIYPNEPVSVSEEDYLRLLERVKVMSKKVEKSKTWWKNF